MRQVKPLSPAIGGNSRFPVGTQRGGVDPKGIAKAKDTQTDRVMVDAQSRREDSP